MPTVLRYKGFRFFFYSLENDEPAHIHIEKGDCAAKFWLRTVQLASNYRFRSHELTVLSKLVKEHRELFLEKWDEHFSS